MAQQKNKKSAAVGGEPVDNKNDKSPEKKTEKKDLIEE